MRAHNATPATLKLVCAAIALTAALGFFPVHADDRGHRGHDARGHDMRRHEPQRREWHGHHQPRTWDTVPHQRHYYPPRGRVVGALPHHHHVIHHHGARFYFSGGIWYRPARHGFVTVFPPVGVVVHALPPVYTTIWIRTRPYYYANQVYYVPSPQGYVVAAPPPEVITEAPANSGDGIGSDGTSGVIEQPANDSTSRAPAGLLFVYPRQGQTEQQQESDRSECHAWALGQTGYDPNLAANGDQPADKYPDYVRALSACLDGRGYTVR